MVDQTRWGVSDVISENKGKTFEIKKKKIEKFQERRIKAMTKLSNKRGWTFGDNNPFFEDVYSINSTPLQKRILLNTLSNAFVAIHHHCFY